ncbi:MAG TPA: hypothetical protein VGO91_03740 [Pyrinomonadaceae bacterium]|jgi:hypothetical protein|nr:hypothetical protein [Pyrinomonadaceae bacterium]
MKEKLCVLHSQAFILPLLVVVQFQRWRAKRDVHAKAQRRKGVELFFILRPFLAALRLGVRFLHADEYALEF